MDWFGFSGAVTWVVLENFGRDMEVEVRFLFFPNGSTRVM
jgi:hypothetical protein